MDSSKIEMLYSFMFIQIDFDIECRSKKLFGFCELKRNVDFEGPVLSQ